MYYYVVDKSSGKTVDFNFKPVDESKKAVFHSKEDAAYFMDSNTRSTLGADKIDSVRTQFEIKELA
ncbi:MAG: hypothetical protein WCQ67_09450 [Treponema sp.]